LRAAATSLLAYVLFATYIGIGALAHDLHFSLGWVVASTVIVWAGPAQVILLTTLASGGGAVQTAIAVALSGIRLFPMVVSLMPVLRTRATKLRTLMLPAHFTAVTFWVESLRLLPHVDREHRIAFANGLGTGLVVISTSATVIGHVLAANLPEVIATGVLFLTPITFLLSIGSNSRKLADWVALGLGLLFAPIAALAHTGVDLVISGVAAGTIAYGVHRWRRGR
jgi:predicted branched-subunit amino acid permease